MAKFQQANVEYFEIPHEQRQPAATLALDNGLGSSAADTFDIACYRGKADLLALVNETRQRLSRENTEESRPELSKQVLESTGCAEWYAHEPGRTPQEQLSDYMWERLEQQRQAFEREREHDRQEFEERLSERAREFQERLSERAEQMQLQLTTENRQLEFLRDKEGKRNSVIMKRITLLGILIASAQVLTLTKDSLLYKVFAALYHWLLGQ